MTFDHRQLRAFLCVFDTGSLGRASAQVNLSQPALSRLVKDMETRLGVALFDRQRTGMIPTAFAEALAPHARLLLFEMGQAVDALSALRGLKRGTIRVGAVAAAARSILPTAISQVLAQAPDLQVELLEAADDRLFHALSNRSIDLAIAGRVPEAADVAVVAECEFNDRYAVICASNHPLLEQDAVTMNDVLAQTWVMPGRGATPRALFEDALRACECAMPRVAIETSSPAAIVTFVAKTRYLGWLPRPLFALEETCDLVRSIPIAELQLARRFMIYRRRQGLLPAAALKLIETLPLKRVSTSRDARLDGSTQAPYCEARLNEYGQPDRS
jgi:DNA-binding transcriptional LysR family regulator